MAALSISSREDFKVVQSEFQKFYELIHEVSKPTGEWSGLDVKRYLFEFMKTEEHQNFDRVRTHFHHQTETYKVWKKRDNKRRYEEKLRQERSTPEAKVRIAALARRRRRRDRYEEVRAELRSAVLLGQDGPALQLLWDAAEDAYQEVVAVEVPGFTGDGYGAPWVEVQAALARKFAAEAATVTPILRKRLVVAAEEVKGRQLDAAVGHDPTVQEIIEFLGEEP